METAVKHPTTNYNDIYQEVTESVIKLLEEGTVIWQSSWNDYDLPKNYLTQTYYRGWNVFLLNFHSARNQYPSTAYLTFKQANQLGGTIKKGEKGVKIIYWATIELKDENAKQMSPRARAGSVHVATMIFPYKSVSLALVP